MANSGEKAEEASDFIFLDSKIIVETDAAMKFTDAWLLGWKAMTNLDSIFKSRDITLLTNVCVGLSKTMVFPVVMYRFESWTIMKAEH